MEQGNRMELKFSPLNDMLRQCAFLAQFVYTVGKERICWVDRITLDNLEDVVAPKVGA